jgi:hypothetical protein
MNKHKNVPRTLSDALLARITQDSRSLPKLAQEAGIDRVILWRFVTLRRNMTLKSADRLAAVLRVHLADDEETPDGGRG